MQCSWKPDYFAIEVIYTCLQIQALVNILDRGFLQLKSTSEIQPFYDYVVSEADKMTQEEYEISRFNAIQNVKSTSRRQVLPKRSATVTTESQKVGILPPEA